MNSLFFRPATSSLTLKAMSLLAILVGAFYIFLAVKNLRGDPQMISDYQRWGCGESVRLLVGVAQLSFGLLLCCRPLCFWGALPLALMMLGVATSWSFGFTTGTIGHLNILSVSFVAIGRASPKPA